MSTQGRPGGTNEHARTTRRRPRGAHKRPRAAQSGPGVFLEAAWVAEGGSDAAMVRDGGGTAAVTRTPIEEYSRDIRSKNLIY